MRIDAHQHFWKLDRGDYDWLSPDHRVLYRDFHPEHLVPHLRKNGIDGTILVQAAATLEETDYLLSLSDRSEYIAGVVGWLDLSDPAYIRHFERFRRHPKFVGFRIMIQDMEKPEAVLEPDFVAALNHFAANGFPVDLLVLADQLPVLIELLRRVPGLRGVVDHLAKPRIVAGELHPWAEHIRELSLHPNLFCKLSGMVTEADHRAWRSDDLVPYVRHVLDCFGIGRVMFGSDWPVCLLAAEYDQVIEGLERALPAAMTEADKRKLYGENAKAFYNV